MLGKQLASRSDEMPMRVGSGCTEERREDAEMASDSIVPPSLVPLGRDECLALLRQGQVGRVAVAIAGQPHIVPLNYAADDRGVLVFRTAELTTAKPPSGGALSRRGRGDDAVVLRFARKRLGGVEPASRK